MKHALMQATSEPQHLAHCVAQNYDRYSSTEHETWRRAITDIFDALSGRCCIPFNAAFKRTGMRPDRIPSFEELSSALQVLNWQIIFVDSFIPPRDFMNLHANSIIPITRSIRCREQLHYTPIPDVIHEAAGHLPMLVVPEYRHFLNRLGALGARLEYTASDLAHYELLKTIAELKGLGHPPRERIQALEREVEELLSHRSGSISKARMVARFHWWTAEFGLIGPDRRIFGAGLLSSAGEAIASDKAQHQRLSLDCLEHGFEITDMQSLYYVADDWDHLNEVLDQLTERTG